MVQPDSLPHAFLTAVHATPDKPFVHFEGHTLTYAQAHREVVQAAGALAHLGVRRGDRVGLYLENSPEFIISYLGVLWSGAIAVPINVRYRQTELTHILEDSAPRLLITDHVGEKEAANAARLTSVGENVVVLEAGRGWNALQAADNLKSPVPLTADDPAVLGYTSGTTGRSKGAILTHGNFCSNSVAVSTSWGWTSDDHLLLVLPLFHTHGLSVGLHGTLIQGSTITLERAFDPAAVLSVLGRGDITMFFGVPTMYSRLLPEARREGIVPAGVRLFVSGSAPLSPQLLADFEELTGHRILERYGMTETVMNLGNPLEGERRPGSVGIPFPGIELRIAHPRSDAPLGVGEIGEIQLRGPNICSGYWNNPAATAEVRTADGWFRTGDLGYTDEDGYTFLTGRAKDLIISGGFNVYPREVEEVLESHPAVSGAVVLGIPDDDFGERVVAAVALLAPVQAAELQAFCGERLAGFKKPREIHQIQVPPRNAMGKIQKHLLREQLGPESRLP